MVYMDDLVARHPLVRPELLYGLIWTAGTVVDEDGGNVGTHQPHDGVEKESVLHCPCQVQAVLGQLQ